MEIITTLFQNKFPISFCEILSSFPRYCSSFWNLILIIYKHFWNLLYRNDSYIWKEECCWAVNVLFGTVLSNSKNNESESIKMSSHLLALWPCMESSSPRSTDQCHFLQSCSVEFLFFLQDRFDTSYNILIPFEEVMLFKLLIYSFSNIIEHQLYTGHWA